MKLRIKERKGETAGAASGEIFVTCVECSGTESFESYSTMEFDLDSNKICSDILVANIEKKEEKKEKADRGVYGEAEDK